MQDVKSEPVASDAGERIPRGRAVLLHVLVGGLSAGVCVLAALLARAGYEAHLSIRQHALDEPFTPTPWFWEFAAMAGVILGVIASVIWCRRLLANRRRPGVRFRPVRLAILLALGATFALHPALGAVQGVMQGMPIPWHIVIGLALFYGIPSALVSGAIAGGIAYHWVAAAILAREET